MQEFSRYNLVRRIGAGGMAEVWKATAAGPEGFQKTVAIKKVLPDLAENREFIAMFVEEAKLVANLVHPNIVQVFDFGGVSRREYFIIMEYVGGQDLYSVMKRCTEHTTRIPMNVALFIAAECAKGLAYAHAKTDPSGRPLGIVHRDMSPGNVLVSYAGEVKITDFGIAKLSNSTERTQAGVVRGNAAYLSPEQAELRPLDHRSDLFTLGVVLFELLTGKRLFTGSNLQDLVQQARDFRFPAADVAGLPPAVQAILTSTLRSEPSRRWQDASEMEDALLDVLTRAGAQDARKKLAALMQSTFEKERMLELDDSPADPDSSFALSRNAIVGGAAETPARPLSAAARIIAAPPPRVFEATPSSMDPPSMDSGDRVTVDRGDRSGSFTQAITTELPDESSSAPKAMLRPATDEARRVSGSISIQKQGKPLSGIVGVAPEEPAPVAGKRALLAVGIAGALLVVTAAALAGRWSGGNPRPADATPTAVAIATGTARPAATPTPAGTPVTVAVVAAEKKVGRLTVYAKPWCEVFVDGKKVSEETPLEDYRISAGRHVLRFENPALKIRVEKTIEVKPGAELEMFVDVPAKKATVTRTR